MKISPSRDLNEHLLTAESSVNHLNGYGHVSPAQTADACTTTCELRWLHSTVR